METLFSSKKPSFFAHIKYKRAISEYTEEVHEIINKLDYQEPESALAIASDELVQLEIEKDVRRFKGVKEVILVGIGGSSLGTEAVYRALQTESSPTLTVVDTVSSEKLEEVEEVVARAKEPKNLAVVVVSKSGTTTETVFNASRVFDVCRRAFGAPATKRFVIISDKGSKLTRLAKKEKLTYFEIPKAISGRFSVFSAAGMVPLYILGVDTRTLRKGAAESIQGDTLKESQGAVIRLLKLVYRNTHLNIFTFHDRLTDLGLWYRQLIAESIGKARTQKGKENLHRIVPALSTTVDLHSMSQLYLSGTKDSYTHFLFAPQTEDVSVHTRNIFDTLLPRLAKKQSADVHNALFEGITAAYRDHKLAFRVSRFDTLDAYAVGGFLGRSMYEIMLYGALTNIDVFDQPAVEDYKSHVRDILKK